MPWLQSNREEEYTMARIARQEYNYFRRNQQCWNRSNMLFSWYWLLRQTRLSLRAAAWDSHTYTKEVNKSLTDLIDSQRIREKVGEFHSRRPRWIAYRDSINFRLMRLTRPVNFIVVAIALQTWPSCTGQAALRTNATQTNVKSSSLRLNFVEEKSGAS